MAGSKKDKKKAAVKVKKKKWYPIYAPKQFSEAQLGETYVAETEHIQGKYLTANLSTIVKSMRKQNVNIHFKVTDMKDGKGYTTVIGYSLINAAIKRLVRRGRDKVADSFISKTKDKKVMRIKPLLITMNKGTKSIQSAIRLEARRVIREHVYTKDAEEVFADIIEGKLQKQIKEFVGKIAPVKSVEIRIAKLEENTKVIVTDKEVESEAVTIRKRDKGEEHISEEEKAALEAAKAAAAAEAAAQEEADAEEVEDAADDSEDFGEEETEEDVEEDSEENAEPEELAEEETDAAESEEVELSETEPKELTEEETTEEVVEEEAESEDAEEEKKTE